METDLPLTTDFLNKNWTISKKYILTVTDV